MSVRACLRLGLGLALVACAPTGGGSRGSLGEMPVERTVLSLLLSPERRAVAREDPGLPVAVDVIAPIGRTWIDSGALPALVTAPPCEVTFALPALEPGAVLVLGVGLDREAYALEGTGAVRFEVELDGARELELELPWGRTVPREEQTWRRAALPLEGRRALVLRTHRSGAGDAPLRAGFGLLEVRVSGRVPRTRAGPQRPNVVLVVVDTLRADALGAYGQAEPTSPNLDALAARGELFERAYSPAPWTWPATASLLTARLPSGHGMVGPDTGYLSDELETLAEAFQAGGVTTAAFSCNPLVTADKNFDQGFETFRAYPWTPTRRMLDDVLAWLDGARDTRFFLYLHLIDPHPPEEPEGDLLVRRPPSPGPTLSRAAVRRLISDQAVGRGEGAARLRRHSRRMRAYYDAEVATADRALGRLLRSLEARGLLGETIVAVTSDHGREFLEHGLMGHGGQLYPESLQVPLILAGPGLRAGVRHREPAELRRLAPTLLALAGVEGRDALAAPGLLEVGGRPAAAPQPILSETSIGMRLDREVGVLREDLTIRGIQEDGLQLMWAPAAAAGGDWVALFDLAADPGTRQDLARGRPAEVERLMTLLRERLEQAAERRPAVLGGGAETRRELRELGYLGGDD